MLLQYLTPTEQLGREHPACRCIIQVYCSFVNQLLKWWMRKNLNIGVTVQVLLEMGTNKQML